MAKHMKKMANKMKKKGRFGDSELVHVNPAEKKMLKDMRGGITTKNPDTGLEEFFGFKSIKKFVKKIGKDPIGALGDAAKTAGILSGNPLYAAAGTLAEGATSGDGLGTSLKNAAGAGLGSYVSGNLFPETTAAFKSYLPDLGIGSSFGNVLGTAGPIQGPLQPGAAGLGYGGTGPLGSVARTFSDFIPGNVPVGAAEQLGSNKSTGSQVGNFLKTPQGLVIASSALGALTDDGKDPYADELKKKREEDKNYIRYNNGVPDYRYAKGGSVHTESDTTRQPRPNPDFSQQVASTVRQLEQKLGRRLDEDEMQDLIGRMGGGIGQMAPEYAGGGPVAGIGSGKSDDIPAMLSDGEHVITADEVSMLGDGSNNAGHKKLYSMRKKLRKHKTGNTKQMPKAKSPEAYAGIGA